MDKYFLGLDIGTQGARIVLVDQKGYLIASDARKFQLTDTFREEQSPLTWWKEAEDMLSSLLINLPDKINKRDIQAISVTSTSGTVIPLDVNHQPIHQAIMYSDPRSIEQGKRCKDIAQKYVKNGYTGFNASSGISKILWYIETFPEKIAEIALWIHASDYLIGKLCGNYHTTDYTNVLKSAYDLEKLEWPDYITRELGIQVKWLQNVVPSGTVVGRLLSEHSESWGIPEIEVVVGMTDGCATQMASGAVKPGDWNTTIGTTLVIKGVTETNVLDPLGRVYSHKHPEGYWMPGGASNTGADWISINFPESLEKLNYAAESLIPTGELAWPLVQEGERYPIMTPQARGFAPNDISNEKLFAANLEGVAFIERLAYEIIEELSGEKIRRVFSAGGGSRSDVWLKIRAAVLKVPIYKCKEANGAFGAAIMAASTTYYNSIFEASENMTSIEKKVIPDPGLMLSYEEQYQEFKMKLKDLNYI